MVKKFKDFDPQLVFAEQSAGSDVSLTNAARLSLYKKSQKSGISIDILEEIYRRGYSIWNESFSDSPEQFAFERVNSFIAGGFAAEHLDNDLVEKRGLWDNIHAKRERIKNGSGEHMRKPGSKGAPSKQDFINSQNEEAGSDIKKGEYNPDHLPTMGKPWHPDDPNADHRKEFQRKKDKEMKEIHKAKEKMQERYEGAEKTSKDFRKPNNRFIGTDELTDTLKKQTPGQSLKETIKRVVAELYECNGNCTCKKEVDEDWSDKKYKNPEGGLTQAGVNAYRREHPGSKLKTAVTTEPSKLKKGSKAANRRKSFCARMGGMKKRLTSAKTANDPDSRINKALRKWHC